MTLTATFVEIHARKSRPQASLRGRQGRDDRVGDVAGLGNSGRGPVNRRVRTFLAALLFTSAFGAAQAAATTERLEIVTGSGPHAFEVEVMRTRPELEKGLMFRREMAANHGMLFDFGQPQDVLMWMKNTYLPLDMVFIDKAGKVINVAHDAVPMTETTIPSGGETLGVLEINAGVANKIGLHNGDTVKASIFRKP